MAFGLLSAAGAGTFILISSFFIAGLCRCRSVFVALGFMGAQEMCSAAYYANSSAVAAPFIGVALLFAVEKPSYRNSVLIAGLIAIAGWIRLDVLLISPVFAPLLILQAKNFLSGLGRTAAIAAGTVALLLSFLWLSGVSPVESWETYSARDGEGSIMLLGRLWWITSSPIWSVVVLAGIAGLVIKRRWWMLCILFCAITPSIWIYGRSFTTTKYLYYAMPFVLLPGFWLLSESIRSSRKIYNITAIIVVSGMVAEACIGVRTSSKMLRRFEPSDWRLYCNLYTQFSERPIQIGWGEGEVLPTADGFRLRGACFHMPYVWNREKRRLERTIRLIPAIMLDSRDKTIVTSTYMSAQVATGILISSNSVCHSRMLVPDNPSSSIGDWIVDGHPCRMININHTERDRLEFSRYTSDPGLTLFINDRGASAASHLGVLDSKWACEVGGGNDLLTLYRRLQD